MPTEMVYRIKMSKKDADLASIVMEGVAASVPESAQGVPVVMRLIKRMQTHRGGSVRLGYDDATCLWMGFRALRMKWDRGDAALSDKYRARSLAIEHRLRALGVDERAEVNVIDEQEVEEKEDGT